MSKERKDNTSKKIVKIVIWLLVMTATALVIWKLYGKIDIKRTDFSKVTVKKQPSTIYDMYKVKSEKIDSSLYYVRIKDIYCDAYKIRETDQQRYFKIDIVFEVHSKKMRKLLKKLQPRQLMKLET